MTPETNDNFTTALHDAEQDLGSGETVLDFSSVHRLDASALRSLENLALLAEEKSARVFIRGANVSVFARFPTW